MSVLRFAPVLAAGAVAAGAAAGAATLPADVHQVERPARDAAAAFFRSINDRRYADTCGLLSDAYYREHHLRDRQTCVAALSVAFMWSEPIRFRITKVAPEGDRV